MTVVFFMSTKHHYVPKFYLKGFLNSPADTYLWVVDLEKQCVDGHAPKNIAYLTGYYDIDVVGNEVVSNKSMFENILSSIESKASSVIQRIRKDDFNLIIKDRFNLSNFIGLQWGRVPSNRDFIAQATTQFYEERLTDHRYIFCSTEIQAKKLLEAYNLAKSKGFPKNS